MNICPYCKCENWEEDRNCLRCGEVLAAGAPAPAPPEAAPPAPSPGPPPAPAPAGEKSPFPFLLCTAGFDAGRRWVLSRSAVVVGRDELEADVLIKDDKMLSRKHLRVVREGDRWFAEVMPTVTNRTFVGDRELKPGDRLELTEGSRIRAGRTDLEFRLKEVV